MNRLSLWPVFLLAACAPAPASGPPSTDLRTSFPARSYDAITDVVRKNMQPIQRCHDDGLTHQPALAGHVVTRFVIGTDGRVIQMADAGSDLPDPGVVRCIARHLLGLTFPPSRETFEVVYPISFGPDVLPASAPDGASAEAPPSPAGGGPAPGPGGEPTSGGRLPAPEIQRIVRQNFGTFHRCYEEGLQRNPRLQGLLTLRFVIGRTGHVVRARNAGSDLPDDQVVDCVVRHALPMVFSPPDGGIVTVVYPISFAPGRPSAPAPSSAPPLALPVPAYPAAPPTEATPWPALSPAEAGDGKDRPSGRLPPPTVQAVVRRSFGAFRLCYEKALRREPRLQGRVAVRFVVGLDGRVTWVGDGGSSLPDPEATRCVIEGFRGLVFPTPEGGIVRVEYPISFAPGD